MDRMITMFQDGGSFMYAILVVFVFAMAIAFERLYQVYFRFKVNATEFMAQIQKLILANNIDRAVKLCNQMPNAALPRVVRAGLLKAGGTEKEIENAIDEATLEIGPKINKRTGFLGMLANVATLTGLLGTIYGLIYAFEAVAKANPENKQTMLANGISIAMYTTAGGLMAAIPTMVLQSIIQAQSNALLDEVDQYGLKTVNLLVARKRGDLSQGAAAQG